MCWAVGHARVRCVGAGNNIRSVYESLVFLFGVHPFDVGDVLLLDNKDWYKHGLLPPPLPSPLLPPTSSFAISYSADYHNLRCHTAIMQLSGRKVDAFGTSRLAI